VQSAPPANHTFSLGNLLPATFLNRGDTALELGALDGHAVRVAAYAYAIATTYGLHPKTCERLRLAAAFHDIGKACLPKSLLNKPSLLTPDERHVVETHTVKGYELLSETNDPALCDAATIALSHHEHLDGSGYPNGLCGSDISLGVRIVSVADVFDALTTNRSYREALSEALALSQLGNVANRHFDPVVIHTLKRLIINNPEMGKQLRWFTRHRKEQLPHHPTYVGESDYWESVSFVTPWSEPDSLTESADFWKRRKY
jgi:HD-GYP domain-containing protein (c-di-GMP phosphodiesterase class II)